jgi:hypothetical protein
MCALQKYIPVLAGSSLGSWLGSGVSGLEVQIFSETRFGSRPKVFQVQKIILRTVVVPEVLLNPIKEN